MFSHSEREQESQPASPSLKPSPGHRAPLRASKWTQASDSTSGMLPWLLNPFLTHVLPFTWVQRCRCPFQYPCQSLMTPAHASFWSSYLTSGEWLRISCGDAWAKEIECSLYFFFFVGPDICGFDIKKVHVILHFKNQYHSNKKSIRCKVNAFVFKSVIMLALLIT